MTAEKERFTSCECRHNGRLSKSFETLAHQLCQRPSLHHLAFNKQDTGIEPFMHSYEYSVSPWPLIIDDELTREMDYLFTQLPKIMHKVLRYFLTNHMSWTCEFLHIQKFQAELFLQSPPRLIDICARYDLVMSGGVLQLIEINSGGSLGGWQLSWFESQCFKALGYLDLNRWRFEHQNIVLNLLNAYCQSILALPSSSISGNILLYLSPDYVRPETLPNLKRNFYNLYKKVRPLEFAEGELFFFESPETVDINEDGEVFFNGKKMDAVILSVKNENELSKSFICQLEAAALKGQLYYPDAQNLSIIGNKLLFAFLHEDRVKALLNSAESAVVEKYVPWSVKINLLKKDWDGIALQSDLWLVQQKNELVIKKAHSQQGKDVVIGSDCTPEEWRDLHSAVAEDDDWLVQKYMAPDPIILADSQNGLNLYDTVWGVFALSGNYSGGFIRGTMSHKGDKVINSARGASEFLLLEEKSVKIKLVI